MDAPVVVSHRTAWLFYHTLSTARSAATQTDYGIAEPRLTPRERVARVRTALLVCGIPASELSELDVLVSFAADRSHARGVRSHVLGSLLTEPDLVSVAPGLLAVSPSLAFVQAATWMEPLELLEWGFELCGDYQRRLLDGSGYLERPALTSVCEIEACLDRHPGMRGARVARRALARVRDRSRSPMETALALAVMLPPEQGGLGCLDIEMNHRVVLPPELRALCPSEHLEVDLFSPRAHAGIEYDGSAHAGLARRTRDADRARALAALGISQQVVTAGHLASQLGFHRALNGVARALGLEPRTDAAFQHRQNELRQELIRAWQHPSRQA